MRVLGIETSCDETGVALYEAGRGIRAERLASQVAPGGGAAVLRPVVAPLWARESGISRDS